MSVSAGACVVVVDRNVGRGWSLCRLLESGKEGLVPTAFLDMQAAVPVRGLALKRRLQRPRRSSSLSGEKALAAAKAITATARDAPGFTSSTPAPLAVKPPSANSSPSGSLRLKHSNSKGSLRSSSSTGTLLDLAALSLADVAQDRAAEPHSTAPPARQPAAPSQPAMPSSLLDLFGGPTPSPTTATVPPLSSASPAAVQFSAFASAAASAPAPAPALASSDMTEDDFFAALNA
ncbi:uncharacterized protein AMSG_11922 [Thecamonas trahens ATCC 50062]|uniref:SH3 domain-containing protein n=1 Tax=Thecamonas trahens ATCC 50062 TaxID=461836 RepID=A0A0L0DEC6_THETB|nr:hypothetical protein AMSG_11922 [Thecamonas trahens ATCC 50062]KNC49678.1 hypothetical protein AMSG_11922 [Thecamonas trahens ATCC 50062]|eukprot:XP_013757602.1 hypothetical protein AMSG_11922 [Thecamonas trahens ATCC 50062]